MLDSSVEATTQSLAVAHNMYILVIILKQFLPLFLV